MRPTLSFVATASTLCLATGTVMAGAPLFDTFTNASIPATPLGVCDAAAASVFDGESATLLVGQDLLVDTVATYVHVDRNVPMHGVFAILDLTAGTTAYASSPTSITPDGNGIAIPVVSLPGVPLHASHNYAISYVGYPDDGAALCLSWASVSSAAAGAAVPTGWAETAYDKTKGTWQLVKGQIDPLPAFLVLGRSPSPDQDGDYIPDSVDNCPAIYNPAQIDWDVDGIGNACDQCVNEAGPAPSGCPTTAGAPDAGVGGGGGAPTFGGSGSDGQDHGAAEMGGGVGCDAGGGGGGLAIIAAAIVAAALRKRMRRARA